MLGKGGVRRGVIGWLQSVLLNNVFTLQHSVRTLQTVIGIKWFYQHITNHIKSSNSTGNSGGLF